MAFKAPWLMIACADRLGYLNLMLEGQARTDAGIGLFRKMALQLLTFLAMRYAAEVVREVEDDIDPEVVAMIRQERQERKLHGVAPGESFLEIFPRVLCLPTAETGGRLVFVHVYFTGVVTVFADQTTTCKLSVPRHLAYSLALLTGSGARGGGQSRPSPPTSLPTAPSPALFKSRFRQWRRRRATTTP